MLTVVALLSGKFSLARLFGGGAGEPWMELRLWATLALAILLLRPARLAVLASSAKVWRLLIGSLVALTGFLAVRTLWEGGGAMRVLDLGYILVQTVLMMSCASDRILLRRTAFALLGLAAVLIGLAASGFGANEANGAGWAPMGGPLTFYRIEFLAFIAAVWLLARANTVGGRLGYFAFSTVTLFATWSSLAKAAYIGSLTVIAGICLALVLSRRYRMAIAIAVVSIPTLVTWNSLNFAFLQSRAAAAVYATENAASSPSSAAAPSFSPDILRPGVDASIRLNYCTLEPQGHVISNSEKNCSEFLMADRSARLLLLAEAVRGFLASPLLGNGLGSFAVYSINRYSDEPETYHYPHNLVAEHLFVGGLVGLTLLAIAVAASVWLAYQVHHLYEHSVYLASYMAFIFLTSLVAGDFYDFRTFWYAAAVCAGIVVQRSGQNAPR